MTIAEKVHAELIRRRKKLALAESCTGGAIASRIIAIPNASEFFLGSIVAYAPRWKEQFLGVSYQMLKQFGAESREVVAEMICGLFIHTEADYAIAVSGFAGPSGKSPGTVFVAVGERGKKTKVIEIQLDGSRMEVIDAAVDQALQALFHWMVPQ